MVVVYPTDIITNNFNSFNMTYKSYRDSISYLNIFWGQNVRNGVTSILYLGEIDRNEFVIFIE